MSGGARPRTEYCLGKALTTFLAFVNGMEHFSEASALHRYPRFSGLLKLFLLFVTDRVRAVFSFE